MFTEQARDANVLAKVKVFFNSILPEEPCTIINFGYRAVEKKACFILILFLIVFLYTGYALSQSRNNTEKSMVESLPMIAFLSKIPKQTDQEAITLEVQIKAPDGIQAYSIKVNGVEVSSQTFSNDNNSSSQPDIHLSVDIPLVIGPNLISIQAVDQLGHSSQQEIRIQRGDDKKGQVIHTLRRGLYFLLKRIFQ